MGLSFAIPIDLAMQIKDQLVKDGKVTRGYVGVYIQEITQELAKSFDLDTPEGALVTKVEKGSPAEKAGLKPGDVIVAVNGQKVSSSIHLPRLVSVMAPGKKAEFTVIRDKKKMTLDVTIGTNQNAKEGGSTTANAVKLGVTTRALTQEEEKQYETSGLLVTQSEGLAAKAGIRAGDVLVTANGKALHSAGDLRSQLQGSRVLLLVQRDNGRIFVPVNLKEKDE